MYFYRHLLTPVFLFTLLCGGSAIATASELALGKFHALIIGNNDYKDPRGNWGKLMTPGENAESLAETLRERFDFENIVLLRNATRREIDIAFDQLSRTVQQQDSVLVYYAGHGKIASKDLAYWIPIDANGQRTRDFISTRDIMEKLMTLSERARHVLLISEAPFHADAVQATDHNGMSISINPRFFGKLSATRSVQALIRVDDSYVDRESGNSGKTALSETILNVMNNNQAPVLTLQELINHLYRQLSKTDKRSLRFGVINNSGDEGGEYLFTRRRATTNIQPKNTSPEPASKPAVSPNKTVILPMVGF
ncbi:MAG: caspase family protein [Gammaproteobacteria bacterium]|nr:caspase family protein [Gammaproteobacteria bacterium]